MSDETNVPEPLRGYDWEAAFGYASAPDRVEGATCSRDAVAREDVVEVKHIDEGYNDGDSWIVCGRLRDGRWFFLSAWCDYDGLAQFGFGSDERTRWGIG